MRRRGVLVITVVVALLAPAAAQAASEQSAMREVREQLARTLALQIPGARVREPAEEPLVGVPGLAELLAGRTEVMLDPAFWTQVVSNLLVSQTVVIPKPVDVIKPEQALPTAPVADGPRVSPLPRGDVDLSRVRYEWQGRKKTLREFVVSTETDTVAFVHEGAIISELHANGWSAGVRHQPWSVTKSFVSALVGIALDEGRVRSLGDAIETYIPDLRGTAWQGTTVQNLLEMDSGVHWDEGTPILAINTQVQQWIQLALDLVTGGALGQTRNEFLASLPREVPAGTRFSYNSGNTQLLAWMLEKVYAKPFNQIVSEKLWVPIGMADDARVMTDRLGDAVASQGLYSRVFDLARFGELFRNGGVTSDGKRVVPQRWTRDSTAMTKNSKGIYAWQWWLGPTDRSYEASGFQGQKISVSPDHCLTGVRLSHTLGGNLRPGGGDPADPASYGFGVEAGGEEWTAAYRAVAAHVGKCSPPARLALGPAARVARAAALRRGALRVVVRNAEAPQQLTLRAVARLGAKRFVVVARRTLTLRAARSRTVSLPLTAAGRRLLRSRRRVTLVVTAQSGDARVRQTVVVR